MRFLIPPPAAILVLLFVYLLSSSLRTGFNSIPEDQSSSLLSDSSANEVLSLELIDRAIDSTTIANLTLMQPSRSPWAALEEDFLALNYVEPDFVDQFLEVETDEMIDAVVEEIALPSIRVLGALSENEHLHALIVDGDGYGTERWVGLGDDIFGWTVVEIRPQSITLNAGAEEVLIEMHR